MDTDRDWEKWGATDPYFGVLSFEPYRKENIDETSRQSFFLSGEEHVENVFRLIAESGSRLDPQSVLDFGCGVGRLAIPFARRAARCVGVDVSPSMLAEAAKNSREAGIGNIEFIRSAGELSGIGTTFSLVHSYIVLQHIPWKRGRNIVASLASKVAANGFLAIQLLTSSSAPAFVQALVRARYAFPPINWIRNIIRRRPVFEPAMQLHTYDKDALASDLRNLGFDEPALFAQADVGEFSSVLLLARRSRVRSSAE